MRVIIKSNKWYGWFWPPERKKIALMQAMYDFYSPKINQRVEKIVKDYLIYGIEPEWTNKE